MERMTKGEGMTQEEYVAKVEKESMDFYKSYFLIKSGQMDGYIYTQDKDGNIEIETNNKHTQDDYYIL